MTDSLIGGCTERSEVLDRGKRLVGVILMIVSIAALAAWEKWAKEKLLYDQVLVLRENVSRGTVLERDMFETVRMDVKESGWLSPKEAETLEGKEAVSFIHKGMPLFPEYFEQAELSAAAKDGRYVLSVPEDWLESLPASLGRGDRAYFFIGKRLLTSAPVAEVNQETRSIELIVTGEQAAALSEAASGRGKLVVAYH